MKLIYLSKGSFNNVYRSLFKTLGIESFHYTNPLKVIDNLDELDPDIIYMVKDDFPRFWKMVLSTLRDKSTTPLFILEGVLDKTETEAFDFLKGSLVLENSSDINSLKYKIMEINKRNIRNRVFYPEPGTLCLGFVKSDDFSFISGTVSEISREELLFTPENVDDISNIPEHSEIKNASLSMGETVINVDLTVINKSENLLCLIKNRKEEYIDLVNILFV